MRADAKGAKRPGRARRGAGRAGVSQADAAARPESAAATEADAGLVPGSAPGPHPWIATAWLNQLHWSTCFEWFGRAWQTGEAIAAIQRRAAHDAYLYHHDLATRIRACRDPEELARLPLGALGFELGFAQRVGKELTEATMAQLKRWTTNVERHTLEEIQVAATMLPMLHEENATDGQVPTH